MRPVVSLVALNRREELCTSDRRSSEVDPDLRVRTQWSWPHSKHRLIGGANHAEGIPRVHQFGRPPLGIRRTYIQSSTVSEHHQPSLSTCRAKGGLGRILEATGPNLHGAGWLPWLGSHAVGPSRMGIANVAIS